MTTPYDRLASTPYGSRLLAQARLPREILRCLHQAQAASGLTVAEIAAATGDRRREVKQAFDGDGSIRPAALARYLHAMGYELELRLVPAGEPRRKVLAESTGGHGEFIAPAGWSAFTGCSGLRSMFDLDIPARIRIDLNARTQDGFVPAHIDRADRPVRVGETVTVYEPDDGVQVPAAVERADGPWLALRVDWDAMTDEAPAEPDPGTRAAPEQMRHEQRD